MLILEAGNCNSPLFPQRTWCRSHLLAWEYCSMRSPDSGMGSFLLPSLLCSGLIFFRRDIWIEEAHIYIERSSKNIISLYSLSFVTHIHPTSSSVVGISPRSFRVLISSRMPFSKPQFIWNPLPMNLTSKPHCSGWSVSWVRKGRLPLPTFQGL